MLKADPEMRPTMTSILNDPYLIKTYIPRSLPLSCLTTAPRSHTGRLSIVPNAMDMMALHTNEAHGMRSPLHPVVKNDPGSDKHQLAKLSKKDQAAALVASQSKPQSHMSPHRKRSHPDTVVTPVAADDANLRELVRQLTSTLANRRIVTQEIGCSLEAEDPMSAPIYWISKWVDFSDRYGLGFALCDNSYGVRFNDVTTLIMLASEEDQLQYINNDGDEYFFSKMNCPKPLSKKYELLKYFRNYMNKYLANTGSKIREAENMARLPYVGDWFRTRTALVFYLTNGTMQVHFFDHVKLVLCPLLGACTFFNADNEPHTYRLDLISTHGATSETYKRLRYALDCANHFLETKATNDGGQLTSLDKKQECQSKQRAVA